MARTPKVVEDRREQIIDAAMRVFAQKGFVRATNRDVAHEAGITTGLIYYYFKSKEDLLRAALEERSPIQIVAQVTPDMLEQPPEVLLPLMLRCLLPRYGLFVFVYCRAVSAIISVFGLMPANSRAA